MFKSLPTLLLAALFVFATFLCPTADAAVLAPLDGDCICDDGMMGDANGVGGPCDDEDLDMFIDAVGTGLFYNVFDFTGDGLINAEDIHGYVELHECIHGPKGK